MTDVAKHTPGPWTLGQGYDTAKDHAVCSGPRIIAKVVGLGYPFGKGRSPQSAADAALIAAAPDLLAVINAFLNCGGLDADGDRRDYWDDYDSACILADRVAARHGLTLTKEELG